MKGSIRTRELHDGTKRYDCIWRTPVGVQKWKSFARRKEAENFLIKTVRSVHDGSYTDLRPIVMDRLFDRWVEDWLNVQTKLGKPKLSTARTYVKIVDMYFRPAFKDIRSDQLTADAIGDFVKTTLAHRIGAGTLKAKTYNNIVTLLGSILRWARRSDQRFLKHDPMEHVKRLPKQQVEREILEPDELRALLTAAQASPPDDVILKVAAFTGLRRGELFGLKWGDVQRNSNGTAGRLYIKRSIVLGRVTTPKTASSVRVVDVPQGLIDELYLYRQAHPPMEGDWLFRNSKGGHLDPDNWFKRRFISIVQRAGLRKFGLHVLRHTYVSLLISQGENFKFISRQVGHSTIDMTLNVYGHLFRETSETAMRRLDERLRAGLVDNATSSNKYQTELAKTPRKMVEQGEAVELNNSLKNKSKVCLARTS